ncbi:Spore germination protein A3 precursor [compost metagenome]
MSIRTEANVVDRTCRDVDLTNPATITMLENETRKIVQSNVVAAVEQAKKMKSDILGFGSQLGKDQPSYWNEVKETWNDDMFLQTNVNYDIDIFIRKTGTTGNTTMK